MPVPRYDIDSAPQFNQIPRLDFADYHASEKAMLDIARAGSEVAAVASDTVDKAGQMYINNMQADTIVSMAKIKADHAGDPEGLRKAMGSYIDGVTQSIPFIFDKSGIKAHLSTQAAQDYVEAVRAQNSAQNTATAKSFDTAIKATDFMLDNINYRDAQDPLSQHIVTTTLQAQGENYRRAVASGFMSQGQADLAVAQQTLKFKINMALGAQQNDKDPAGFALKVRFGQTGNENYDHFPSTVVDMITEKGSMLAAAQANYNNQKKQDTVAATIQERQDAEIGLLKNPLSQTTTAGQAMVYSINNKFTSSEDYVRTAHINEFLKTFGDAKWQVTDPKVYAQAKADIGNGNISPDQLLQLHGNGLSTTSYLQLLGEQTAYKTVLDQRPIFTTIKNEMATITANAPINNYWWNKPSDAVSKPDIQQRADDFMVELQTKVVDGTLKSDEDIQKFWNMHKPTLQTLMSTSSQIHTRFKTKEDIGNAVMQRQLDPLTAEKLLDQGNFDK